MLYSPVDACRREGQEKLTLPGGQQPAIGEGARVRWGRPGRIISSMIGTGSNRTSNEHSLIGAAPVLFYDGTCGFCARSLQFVLRHEGGRDTLRFARLEGPLGVELRRRHPELAGIDSLVWYEPATPASPERLLWRSRGALRVARYLGGIWAIFGSLGLAVPRPVSDAVYDWIARHRRQLGPDACIVPTPEQRQRFIDA